MQDDVRKTEAELLNESGQSLAAWLNSPKRNATRQSIRRLLEGLKSNQWSAPVKEAREKVARLVGHYRYRRTFEVFLAQAGEKEFLYPTFGMERIVEGSRRRRLAKRQMETIVDQLASLTDRRLLGRVICCQWCRTWFYGVREDQKFCKRACKVAFEHDSVQYKDYQRRKQAERYLLKKQGKVLVKRRKG